MRALNTRNEPLDRRFGVFHNGRHITAAIPKLRPGQDPVVNIQYSKRVDLMDALGMPRNQAEAVADHIGGRVVSLFGPEHADDLHEHLRELDRWGGEI